MSEKEIEEELRTIKKELAEIKENQKPLRLVSRIVGFLIKAFWIYVAIVLIIIFFAFVAANS